MQVEFQEFNPFDLWIWLEFETVPSQQEKQYVEEVFDSWFFLGKLGGFNAENLPVQAAGVELSYLDYHEEADSSTLMALMHNMGNFEYEGYWARCWLDLGTSDAIALDILINALKQFDQDYVSINRLIIGGDNPDWPVLENESRPRSFIED